MFTWIRNKQRSIICLHIAVRVYHLISPGWECDIVVTNSSYPSTQRNVWQEISALSSRLKYIVVSLIFRLRTFKSLNRSLTLPLLGGWTTCALSNTHGISPSGENLVVCEIFGAFGFGSLILKPFNLGCLVLQKSVHNNLLIYRCKHYTMATTCLELNELPRFLFGRDVSRTTESNGRDRTEILRFVTVTENHIIVHK